MAALADFAHASQRVQSGRCSEHGNKWAAGPRTTPAFTPSVAPPALHTCRPGGRGPAVAGAPAACASPGAGRSQSPRGRQRGTARLEEGEGGWWAGGLVSAYPGVLIQKCRRSMAIQACPHSLPMAPEMVPYTIISRPPGCSTARCSAMTVSPTCGREGMRGEGRGGGEESEGEWMQVTFQAYFFMQAC